MLDLSWKRTEDRNGEAMAMIDFPGLGCDMYPHQIEAMIKELQNIKELLDTSFPTAQSNDACGGGS